MVNSVGKRTFWTCLFLATLIGLLWAAAPGASPNVLAEQSVEPPANARLISDSLFLYAPSVLDFDIQEFLNSQAGPLAGYVEEIDGQSWTAAESIQYNAMLYGINPQLLLTLLEAQGQTLTNHHAIVPLLSDPQTPAPSGPTFHTTARLLARQALLAYDAHRYGDVRTEMTFSSGETISLPEAPNAGSYAVQATLAELLSLQQWLSWVAGPQPPFVERFSQWFGDPLQESDQVFTAATSAPTGYILPFPIGETWYYTGGPHYYGGGTPGCTSGAYCPRPWSSLDIAQPELIACPNGSFPAHRWIVAAKSGDVIQSSQALIVIDHKDGWRTYYSHVSSADKRGTGPVERGDRLGHPSCEVEPGGYTTGVHVHFALYQVGVGFVDMNGMSFSGWIVGETSHYNGTMNLNGAFREASTGRYNGTNDILNQGVSGFCPVSGGVLLYKHINYDCDGDGPDVGYVLQQNPGFQDLPESFNDQSSSIRIPDGWSVRLYESKGRQGASICRNGDDSTFSGDYFEGSAILLNDQVSSIEVFDVDDCSGPYQGGTWNVTYFGDQNLTNPCTSVMTIDGAYVFQDWGSEKPAETCPEDNWSGRYSRYAYFPAGDYMFALMADDRARLKVNGETVIDNWSGAGQTYNSRNLPAGSHLVTVEYADLLGDAYLSAWWQGQGYVIPRQDQDPAQWYASYWANRELLGDPVLLLNEGTGPLNHAWAEGGPGYELPTDRFSGRFESQIPMLCGTYRFQLHTDDGVRFWVNDEMLLDAWFDQVGNHELALDLETGFYQFKVEHYENGGLAALDLSWIHESFCPLPQKFYLPLIRLGQK